MPWSCSTHGPIDRGGESGGEEKELREKMEVAVPRATRPGFAEGLRISKEGLV